jgi:hypothetical protein
MRRKSLTLSANVPEALYVAACQHAADNPQDPGGRVENDVASGFLTRANREALFGFYLPSFDFWPWQKAESERISAERSERMSGVATRRGVSNEVISKQVSLLERLLKNPAMRKQAMANASEEDLELIALLSGDNEA